jgi:hypothetical protein
MPRLGKEVEEVALVELCLPDHTALQESFAALIEGTVEEGKEDGGIFAEDVAVLVAQLAEDIDLAKQ